MDCEFCKKTFSSKSNLLYHQKSVKYCLEIQGKDNKIMECEYCTKNFTMKHVLNEHYYSCKEKLKKDYGKEYENENKKLKEKLDEKETLIAKLKQDKDAAIAKLEEKIDSLQKAIIDIASIPQPHNIPDLLDNSISIPIPIGEQMNSIVIELLQEKDNRIKRLENVCLSKQRRIEYPDRNVIYILTTEDHLKRRTYIIGKAKNLTNRLSTYNKTCDHTVVHHRKCKSEHDMDTAENMVINKLRDYKEQANRDRFILPENKQLSFFSDTIDECVRFFE